MSILELALLLFFLVSVFMTGISWYIKSPAASSRVLVFFCTLLIYLSLTTFLYQQSGNYSDADRWLKSLSFWPLVLAVIFHFAAVSTSRWEMAKNRLFYILLYIPALAFSLLSLTTNLIPLEPQEESWGWATTYRDTFTLDLVFIWSIVITIWATFLCWQYYYASVENRKRQLAGITATGVTIGAIGGWMIAEILLPWLKINAPLMGAPFLVTGTCIIIYGFYRYKPLAVTLTPSIAAESIFSNMADLLFIVDTQGRIIRANEAAVQLSGYDERQLIGLEIQSIFPQATENEAAHQTRGTEIPLLTVAFSGLETVLKTESGKEIVVSLSKSQIHDTKDRIDGLLFIARDISERKVTEDMLHVQDMAIYSSMAAIVMTDLKGRIFYVNQAFLTLWGYEKESEVTGKYISDFRCSPLSGERIAEEVIEKGAWNGELVTLKKDGSPLEARLSANLVISDNGHPICMFASFLDISDIKKAEQDINGLYLQERELRQSLEIEMERRVNFTRALVHELKTPLTPILAGSELLADELAEERLARVVRNIKQSAAVMNDRIDTLLDIAKGELGMLTLVYSQVDPTEMLLELTIDMSVMAAGRGLDLVLDTPDALPSIRAEKKRIVQVFMNLLTNAFKWSPHGGAVTISTVVKDDNVIFSITDMGPGISKENREKVFETYYRVKNEGAPIEGLGLGLALCKAIVELHGGTIWIEDTRCKGSTFRFSIPIWSEDDRQ